MSKRSKDCFSIARLMIVTVSCLNALIVPWQSADHQRLIAAVAVLLWAVSYMLEGIASANE